MKKNKIYLLDSRRKTSYIPLVLTVIVGFLVVFPFVAVNLRFQTGYLFSEILDYIGGICLTVGGFFTALAFISMFLGRKSLNLKMLTTGIVLLWAGCWLTGQTIEFLGIGSEHTSPGYH